jgi:hypothetical protein
MKRLAISLPVLVTLVMEIALHDNSGRPGLLYST